MLSSLRRRATYANVAATLALVFSMSGGALAASHYLVTSKSQISPKVLKQLKGKTGKTGAAGAPGAPGAPGAAGSAVAYASVVVNGVGNPTFTINSGFTAVTEPQAGVFCLTPAFAGHTIVTSVVGTEAVLAQVSPQQCPGGYELATNQTIGNGDGFNVTVP
jgi:hypothetical protein